MSFNISIVIPTWNGLHLLRENLPSVQKAAETYGRATGMETEIVIVDDGSHDGTAEKAPSEFPEIQLVRHEENQGFAAACNSGFRRCRFPVIALLNNDVRLKQDYLLHQAAHFSDPALFAVTAKVFDWDRPIFASGGKVGRFRRGFWSVYFNYDVSLDTARQWVEEHKLLSIYAVGGFASYSKEKLDALGGFTELLSPFHWEDVDLSYRGWKRGWQIHYEPRSVAYHRTSATINRYFQNQFVQTVALRNRLLFHWINLFSPSYLLGHLAVLGLLVLSRLWVLDVRFYLALSQAVQRLDKVKGLRRSEREKACRSDQEIALLLKRFYRSAPIEIYYNQREVIQRHPEFKETPV